MKKLKGIILAAICLMFVACGSDKTAALEGMTQKTYDIGVQAVDVANQYCDEDDEQMSAQRAFTKIRELDRQLNDEYAQIEEGSQKAKAASDLSWLLLDLENNIYDEKDYLVKEDIRKIEIFLKGD